MRRLTGILAMALLGVGCASGGRGYQRGNTAYRPGTAEVTQPDISHKPDRNFKGLRVAGSDTDIVPDYWERELALSGSLRTSEKFKMRYRDLEVYQSGAQDSALRSFREFCKARGLLAQFDAFWTA